MKARFLIIAHGGPVDPAVDRHRKPAQAIANRDPNEARLWMSAHFDESVGIMLGGAR